MLGIVLSAECYPATDRDPNASLVRMVKATPSDSTDQPFYSRWVNIPKACTVVAILTGHDGDPQTAQSYPLGPDYSYHPLRGKRLMAATTGDVFIGD